MNVHEINQCFIEGTFDQPHNFTKLFPKLQDLKNATVILDADFGLTKLPREPGLILIRGSRQLGKSTWMERALFDTLKENGPGSAFFLNGDHLLDQDALFEAIQELVNLFPRRAKVKRIFIDEITAIKHWEKAIKRLADQGITRDTLLITTGSQVIDLRRATERLPGRKGKLDRTNYRFTPVSYSEFCAKTKTHFPDMEKRIWAYVLTGGSPIAINELIMRGHIPEYVIELTRDWIFGETTLQGRQIETLKWILDCLFTLGGLPMSLHTVAEKAGIANNTVAQGYIGLLKDLGCLSSAIPLDANHLRPVPRKSSKYHFTNSLAVTALHSSQIRTVAELMQLPGEEKGKRMEWLVAQELWRRAAIAGEDTPEQQYFWRNDEHEIDFVVFENKKPRFIEVKSGKANASEFLWFTKVFPKHELEIICQSHFDSSFCESKSFESFLLETK